MIPYDIDPTLHTAEPESQLLDDGFSPPQPAEPAAAAQRAPADEQLDPQLSGKSPF